MRGTVNSVADMSGDVQPRKRKKDAKKKKGAIRNKWAKDDIKYEGRFLELRILETRWTELCNTRP